MMPKQNNPATYEQCMSFTNQIDRSVKEVRGILTAMNQNCDIVGMANFAPILNTRGCIYSNASGIVLRSTYYVFDIYVNYMGDIVIDTWEENEVPQMTVSHKNGMIGASSTFSECAAGVTF